MNSYQNLDIERVLDILERQVFQYLGRHLLESERVVIKGSWDGKDYKVMAQDAGYNTDYLHKEVGPQLWTILSEVIGNGVSVNKRSLKTILLKIAKQDYLDTEVSKLDDDILLGKTKFYGDFPKLGNFYGRKEEISFLKYKINIFKERCISLVGVGGIGKSFLTAKLIEEILFENPNTYEYIIWKAVGRSLLVDDIVNDLINIFQLKSNKKSLPQKISLLSQFFHLHRCLLVLDGFEKLARVENFEKRLEYEDFVAGIIDGSHNSCTIVTSQVPLKEIFYVTTDVSITSFKIEGLDKKAAIQMLSEKGITGNKCKDLIEIYRGNPSELEAVADRITRIFGSSLEKFFEYKTTVIGPRIEAMLNRQFGQDGLLTNLQREIMIYLAEEIAKTSAPIPFSKLIDDFRERFNLEVVSVSQIIISLEILEQRSLIETSKKLSKQELHYGMEPVVKKYILVDPYGLVYKSSNKKELTSYVQGQNSP